MSPPIKCNAMTAVLSTQMRKTKGIAVLYGPLSLLSIQHGCITHLKQNDIAKAEEDELLVHNKT